MDLRMTATQPGHETNMENGTEENGHVDKTVTEPPVLNQNIITDVVGGQDFTSIRPQFDLTDQHIVLANCRQLSYFSTNGLEQVTRATTKQSKLKHDEVIVACERYDNIFFLFTNYGKIFQWNHETKDWHNELHLHLEDNERLISCKPLSKRQYLFTILSPDDKSRKLYYSMSRSERERPKTREYVGLVNDGSQTSFDIGMIHDQDSLSKSPKNLKMTKLRIIAFINGRYVNFRFGGIGQKLTEVRSHLKLGEEFVCVRACMSRPCVATGDAIGRIFLYSGDFKKATDRIKLHWHALPVNDLCFSSTGLSLFSVGGESGCVVIWDLSPGNIGQKHIIARLGLPIRNVNCGRTNNQLVLGFEDNEIQILDTSKKSKRLPTLTRRGHDIFRLNDHKALRIDHREPNANTQLTEQSPWLMWHSVTDTIVTNSKPGHLQFYSPKSKSSSSSFNFLKCKTLSLEQGANIVPSDIVKGAFSLDGHWLAFHESKISDDLPTDVKLHIWQKNTTRLSDWTWIQTADRIHSDSSVIDLQFSPDGQFLTSLCGDGSFHLFHRISLDPKSPSKQIYAKGFAGKVPKDLAAMVAFSEDSSVMAISLKNDTTSIWMIVDPYKLVFECQLSQVDVDMEINNASGDTSLIAEHKVLCVRFGRNETNQANLCEVRSRVIRIWNILEPDDIIEYFVNNLTDPDEFVAATFDQSLITKGSPDYFAVATRQNLILLFCLDSSTASRKLTPLVMIDTRTPFCRPTSTLNYSSMCFLNNPILEIDSKCDRDPHAVGLLNRLCLMNSRQELFAISDRITLDKQHSASSCNSIETADLSDLQVYFLKSKDVYRGETKNIDPMGKMDPQSITQKQVQIKKRMEVKRVMGEILSRIPSHNLPRMEFLGPMILDKLI